MSKIKFEMRPVDKKREKKYLKGSKYDPMIDQFLESGHDLVQITVNKKASYVVTQLNKRIERRGLDAGGRIVDGTGTAVVASWVGDIVYLEKVLDR